MDTQPANRIWLPTQPRHYTTREKIPLSRQLLKMGTRWPETCWATYKKQLIRRNKYNTKWHLVGFLFHIELRCTVNHTSSLEVLITVLLMIQVFHDEKTCRWVSGYRYEEANFSSAPQTVHVIGPYFCQRDITSVKENKMQLAVPSFLFQF